MNLTKQTVDSHPWRLTCLKEDVQGLRMGDFGIICNGLGRGKTVFFDTVGDPNSKETK